MKKILLLFLFISTFTFGQEKNLFKAISYNNVIELFNQKLDLKNENLDRNIDLCLYIVSNAKTRGEYKTEVAFSIFLKGLKEARTTQNRNRSFLLIYEDPTFYSFYDSQNKFIGKLYKEELKKQIILNGDNTETYMSNYFYLSQY